MKMIELFIPKKLVLLVFTAELNHTGPRMVKRGSRFSEVASVSVRLDHGASSIVNAGHDRRERLWCNRRARNRNFGVVTVRDSITLPDAL
jgi:hypothetical protein